MNNSLQASMRTREALDLTPAYGGFVRRVLPTCGDVSFWGHLFGPSRRPRHDLAWPQAEQGADAVGDRNSIRRRARSIAGAVVWPLWSVFLYQGPISLLS